MYARGARESSPKPQDVVVVVWSRPLDVGFPRRGPRVHAFVENRPANVDKVASSTSLQLAERFLYHTWFLTARASLRWSVFQKACAPNSAKME